MDTTGHPKWENTPITGLAKVFAMRAGGFRRMISTKWWLILLLGILLQPAESQAQTMLEPFGCPFGIPAGEVEGETILCGIVLLPEDRSDPASPLIEIAYAVITAQSATPAPDPLVYLEGGPGGSALSSFDLWLESPFRQNRDIILIDQRGAGFSFPRLNCWEVETEIDFYNEDYVDVQYENALVDCFDRLEEQGIDLTQYNTINNANDVADLMQALGYPQYNLYGVSYGTRLALTVLAERPENVRSVVLDSAYPPVVDAYEEGPLNTYRVFQQLFTDCAADPACNAAYPALEDRFFALVDALNDDPIFMPSGFEDLSGDILITEMFSLFYDTRVLPYLPRMIAELEINQFDTYIGLWSGTLPPPTAQTEADAGLNDPVLLFVDEMLYYTDTMSDEEFNAVWDALAAIPPAEEDRANLIRILDAFFRPADALYLADLLNSMSDSQIDAIYDELWWEDVSDTDGMFNSFECHEEMPFNNINDAELAARDAGIPPQIVLTEIEAFEEMRRVCSIWRVGTAPDRQDAAITSDVPTLVLAGDYDPITPPAWGQVAADSLSNSYFYTFPGVGRGVIDGGDCPVSVAQSFLDAPGAAPDTSCINTMRIEFVTE